MFHIQSSLMRKILIFWLFGFLTFSTFWVKRCPFSLFESNDDRFSTVRLHLALFVFVWLCFYRILCPFSTSLELLRLSRPLLFLLNFYFTGYCSTFFEFVQHYRILFDFVGVSSILPGFVRFSELMWSNFASIVWVDQCWFLTLVDFGQF